MSRWSFSKPWAISYSTCARSAASVLPCSVARTRRLCARCFAWFKLMSAPSRDGCVGASIVFGKRAGTHRAHLPYLSRRCRTAGRGPGPLVSLASYATTSVPALACITKRDVPMVIVRRPQEPRLAVSDVRADECNSMPSGSCKGDTGSKLLGDGVVFMPPLSRSRHESNSKTNPNFLQPIAHLRSVCNGLQHAESSS
jgi:hypothetical protein